LNNYKEYKLKIGLEIHFQLNTRRKLFCDCPVGMNKDIMGIDFIRRLRPTQSELGQVDPAAYFEFEKGLEIKYYAPQNLTCLVETDEEPPHNPSEEAIKIALQVADFFNMYIVDEIHFMRKVVIDGSNTTGFQRTCVIGLDGSFILNGKEYGVQTLCLEEEAARLIEKKDNQVVYYLDRLGIPLIEIATSPSIESPEEAVKVAEYIGRVVQATGKRRRGIGSIRQDINISILDGPVVEIKGVQRLDLLKDVIEYEFSRQKDLVKIMNILKDRGIREKEIEKEKHVDVTDVFAKTRSKVLSNVIRKKGRVYAIKLPGFKSILGYKIAGMRTFATEFVDRLRFWTGIKGLFHSDELPAYGITIDEIDKIVKILNLDRLDGFIIVGTKKSLAGLVFEKIKERAIEALKGVPTETRGAREDGTTFYLRPRPGMARMYPETDIPPIPIEENMLSWIKENRIQDPEATIEELREKYKISREKAEQIYDEGLIDAFTNIMERYGSKLSAGYISSLLTETPKALQREGLDTTYLSIDVLNEILKEIYEGKLEKETVTDVLRIVLTERISVAEALSKLNITKVSVDEIKSYLLELVNSRKDILELPPKLRRKRLIGIIMSKYRGRISPSEVIKIIDKVLADE